MLGNVPDSHGLEIWRRLNRHFYPKNESRRAELYRFIHKPRMAQKSSDIPDALEE